MAYELALFAEEDTNRLLINLPPGHLKDLAWLSLLGGLVAWRTIASLKIIIVSHAEHLSKAIARKIRSIVQSAWFKDLFATRIKKGHAEVTDFGTTSGGGVFVTSFQAGFTGRRADLIIVDDPHDIGDKIEQIQATIEKFNTVLLSRLNDRKNGRLLVIAHRVNERDLSAHLIGRRNWKHVTLPLIAITDQTFQTSKGSLWHRKRGELLRPEFVWRPRTSTICARVPSIRISACCISRMPRLKDCRRLAADHFPVFSDTMLIPGPVVLSIDTAMSSRPRSAYSVIQAGAWRAIVSFCSISFEGKLILLACVMNCAIFGKYIGRSPS